jgi:hypothetical protein
MHCACPLHDFAWWVFINVFWFLIWKGTFDFDFIKPMPRVWEQFFRFTKPLVVQTSQKFRAWLKLRSVSIQFTMHQTKINNLHKYYSHSRRMEYWCRKKMRKICNQRKQNPSIQWNKPSNPLCFAHLKRQWLVSLRDGDALKKKPRCI